LQTRSLGPVAIALVAAMPAIAIAGTSTFGSVATSPAPQGDLPEGLQTRLREALDQATYNVPGAAVGVWVPGKGTWIGAAGLADLKTNAPVTKDMIWPLRSITKSFTVTLILQLADEGKLSLDDPIDKYVSGVTAVRRLPCASSPACRAATPTM
jgi:D-alanyl-D-alanine carboxypeptidase